MPKRTPGGDAAANDAAPAVVEIEDADAPAEDARTPGLVANADGTVTYLGKVHRRAFMTPHGMVVPPASVEPVAAARLR
jgi:hypothetical protein